MGHGGGGRLTQDLINRIFRPAFANAQLEAPHDLAMLPFPGGGRLAFTTVLHVVSPLFFPGEDIGKTAINGTVNDLCMCGARPFWISAGFILEEGFSIETLEKITRSMKAAADDAGVAIVADDKLSSDLHTASGKTRHYAMSGRWCMASHGIFHGPFCGFPG